MYYLIILMLYSNNGVIIPEKYSSLETCQKAASSIANRDYICVLAPSEAFDLSYGVCKFHLESSIANGPIGTIKKVCD